jgi:hypothetical protein
MLVLTRVERNVTRDMFQTRTRCAHQKAVYAMQAAIARQSNHQQPVVVQLGKSCVNPITSEGTLESIWEPYRRLQHDNGPRPQSSFKKSFTLDMGVTAGNVLRGEVGSGLRA